MMTRLSNDTPDDNNAVEKSELVKLKTVKDISYICTGSGMMCSHYGIRVLTFGRTKGEYVAAVQ